MVQYDHKSLYHTGYVEEKKEGIGMLAIARRNAILELLREHQSVNVTELATSLGVATETIRRDFKEMEAAGQLIRTHGGAYITEGVQNDISVSMRSVIRQQEKKAIAQKCARLIHTGDSIFLDASTTDWVLAQELLERHITVLTNSLKVAEILSASSSVQLILAGGSYVPRSMSFSGEQTVEDLSRYFVDKAFISCRTVHMEFGATDSNEGDALTRRTMLRRSHSTYLLVDHSKLDGISFLNICPLESLTAIICDQPLSPPWQSHLKEIGVQSI